MDSPSERKIPSSDIAHIFLSSDFRGPSRPVPAPTTPLRLLYSKIPIISRLPDPQSHACSSSISPLRIIPPAWPSLHLKILTAFLFLTPLSPCSSFSLLRDYFSVTAAGSSPLFHLSMFTTPSFVSKPLFLLYTFSLVIPSSTCFQTTYLPETTKSISIWIRCLSMQYSHVNV